MSSTKLRIKENRTHKELDARIRNLLLYNLNANVFEAKMFLEKLKEMKKSEKVEMINLLTIEYNEELGQGMYTAFSIKNRIRRWEEHIEPVQMEDISELLEDTQISYKDIFPERITPQIMEKWLGQYLIGQSDYARKIALAFFVHKSRMDNANLNLPRTNLLVHGPSGAGKTYGAQKMAEYFEIPFGVINCNSLVQEGIMGNSIHTFFTKMYKQHGKEMENAVILFDEFDKLMEKGEYNERILNELLNIIDDNNSVTFNQTDEVYKYEKVTISTNKMLFIFTGVFKNLEGIIKKRLGNRNIGFEQCSESALTGDYHQYATEEDFSKLFNRAELSGRIQQYACVRELEAEDMTQLLLNSKESPVNDFKNYFQTRNISFSMTKDGAMAIAATACKRHLGVRGLKSLIYKALSDDMFLLNNKKIIMNENYVMKKVS